MWYFVTIFLSVWQVFVTANKTVKEREANIHTQRYCYWKVFEIVLFVCIGI